MTYCKPGDLAVVVEAYNACNIGTIVHVIGLYTGQSGLFTPEGDVIWEAQASHPLTYDYSGVLKRRRIGPVPDSQLRPIRGAPQAKTVKEPNDLVTT
jgi:hypothetical protein